MPYNSYPQQEVTTPTNERRCYFERGHLMNKNKASETKNRKTETSKVKRKS